MTSGDARGPGRPRYDGHHRVTLRGVEIELAIQYYPLWMLGRVHAEYDALNAEARGQADEILAATGLAPLIETRPKRRIERVGYTEVLA